MNIRAIMISTYLTELQRLANLQKLFLLRQLLSILK